MSLHFEQEPDNVRKVLSIIRILPKWIDHVLKKIWDRQVFTSGTLLQDDISVNQFGNALHRLQKHPKFLLAYPETKMRPSPFRKLKEISLDFLILDLNAGFQTLA